MQDMYIVYSYKYAIDIHTYETISEFKYAEKTELKLLTGQELERMKFI